MIDFIADYGSGLFGLIITVFTAYLDYKQSTGPYRWFNWKIALILFLGICIFVSSCLNENNNKKEKEVSNKKIDSLNQSIRSIRTSQSKFEKVLLEKFKIVRDTTSNLPKRVNTYNTNIGTAGTVNIGTN